jgi:hypothetical protein
MLSNGIQVPSRRIGRWIKLRPRSLEERDQAILKPFAFLNPWQPHLGIGQLAEFAEGEIIEVGHPVSIARLFAPWLFGHAALVKPSSILIFALCQDFIRDQAAAFA